MRMIILTVAIALFLTSLPCFAKPTPISRYSTFITANREAFQSAYGMRQDKALARELGFGSGVYIGQGIERHFEWYASTLPDGFVQFQFSVILSYPDRSAIMIETDATSDRPWDVRNEETQTWFGTDNAWTVCVARKNCDYRKILDSYIAKFMKYPFLKDLKVTTYL